MKNFKIFLALLFILSASLARGQALSAAPGRGADSAKKPKIDCKKLTFWYSAKTMSELQSGEGPMRYVYVLGNRRFLVGRRRYHLFTSIQFPDEGRPADAERVYIWRQGHKEIMLIQIHGKKLPRHLKKKRIRPKGNENEGPAPAPPEDKAVMLA